MPNTTKPDTIPERTLEQPERQGKPRARHWTEEITLEEQIRRNHPDLTDEEIEEFLQTS